MDGKMSAFISSDALLKHWQGHRRLTRRVIEAFPDDQLFTFSLGGMRTFGSMAMEMLAMGVPMLQGVLSGEWKIERGRDLEKAETLRRWDEATERINELWPQIPAERFAETTTVFGQYTDTLHNLILYVIDNEIHHRGEGYVYLRALGIEPPMFYDRS
jgi:uncharacterized damage-inducible protein DinB